MPLAAAVLMSTLIAGAAEVSTVQAPDSPVRLDRVAILTAADARRARDPCLVAEPRPLRVEFVPGAQKRQTGCNICGCLR